MSQSDAEDRNLRYSLRYAEPPTGAVWWYFEGVCVWPRRYVGDNIVNLGTYADMRAPYWIWKNRDDYDIIGFHGYRKFFDFFKPPEYGTPVWWHDVEFDIVP